MNVLEGIEAFKSGLMWICLSALAAIAVGVPMLAMQGASRFWVAEVATNCAPPDLVATERDPPRIRLTWENFFLNADTNALVNAQIELVANGDFVTRSNDVERIYRRVEPFDWDDDGLENTVDPDPLVAGPDAHGTNAEWYNVVCGEPRQAGSHVESRWRRRDRNRWPTRLLPLSALWMREPASCGNRGDGLSVQH